MPDVEKVIEGLECHLGNDKNHYDCDNCQYGPMNNECDAKLIADVLVLLKSQEPVEPKAMQEGWYCSNCGGTVGFFDYSEGKVCGEITYNFCPDCGRKVKWC